VAFLSDIGYPIVAASAALGAVGICSAIGKFGFGLLCDYIKPNFALAIGLAMQLSALIIMMTVDVNTPTAVVWTYSIIYGLGIGCWLPTLPMIVTTTFGLVAYGAIYGTMNLIHVSGSSTGPLVTGLIFDATKKYDLAFIIFIILYVIAIGLILVIRRPKSPAVATIDTSVEEKV
jgi:predicted MFS family arabinose efflux permease